MDYLEHYRRTGDTYGTPRPYTGTRFRVFTHSHDPDDEPSWRHKLMVVDRAFQCSEGYPVDAIAGGRSWADAFVRAASMIREALDSKTCVF